jgi:transcriptional regulator with XRE-family HTH domain
MPSRLAEKLFLIRWHLKLTQEQMVERLRSKMGQASEKIPPLYPGHVSEYEQGKREPPLVVLLYYARLAEVPLENLVDDGLNLPGSYFSYEFDVEVVRYRKNLNRSRSTK